MEKYYFISSNNKKEGPFNFEELKRLKLNQDTEIWRSDFDNWKKITEVEELINLIYFLPPKTNKEVRSQEFTKNYTELLKLVTLLYFVFSILISIISLVITQNSWNKFLETLKENNIDYQSFIQSESSSNMISVYEVSLFNRYPMYQRGVDLENIYGIQQGDLFRVYKPFFTTNYITRKERNEGTLFINLILSSFFTNFIFFILILLILYIVKKP